jgi:hypothetical protein
MIEPARAVFLSCVSQDAEATRRVCDALQVAGIEGPFAGTGEAQTQVFFRASRSRTRGRAQFDGANSGLRGR